MHCPSSSGRPKLANDVRTVETSLKLHKKPFLLINQEFELNPAGTYKINYQVLPEEWYSLTDDTCLKSCISSYRTSKNIDQIKLCVVAVEK
ncbi:hypothetical protein L1987_81229 [Smallanthus sonchifolius]|uniref:Uncharacterized protein n=1 Tax=Smallanthus sonchifolius TaxID=185202 RepID=A0ACB8YP75_9ASTR|nr:hypothetical protein L1987_81229 [Smallanthus sonchifolius]